MSCFVTVSGQRIGSNGQQQLDNEGSNQPDSGNGELRLEKVFLTQHILCLSFGEAHRHMTYGSRCIYDILCWYLQK